MALVLYIIAAVVFALATFEGRINVDKRVGFNLVALGLVFLTIAELIIHAPVGD